MIGITGGIGSGKTVVGRLLAAQLCCPFISVDELCRDLMSTKGEGLRFLKAQFGGRFFCADGSLNRSKLRDAIFSNSVIRKQLDAFIHPLAKCLMRKECAKYSSSMIVVEVPLLFEAGWQEEFCCIVAVYASERVCLQRISLRDQVSVENALRAINVQGSLGDKVLLSRYVIDNNGFFVDTLLQVKHLAKLILESKNGVEVKKKLTETPEDNKQRM
ncbi:MAG: dephospho-CoA kinase [Desulfobulbaceae bacterium]|nr:dephospho-CoA kinase [Desulfobulbaceae bacterium]